MVCASRATGRALVGQPVQGVEILLVLEEPHRLRRDGHCAHRLLVAGVTDVQDGEPLAAPHLELVVHLGHERADGVDDGAAPGPGRLDDLGRRAVGAQHQGAPGGHVGHVIDEDHALVTEALDHMPVVDDLVVAVHRRLEDPHHPGQGFDRLLDAGAEPPRLGQHHSVDSGHKVQVIGTNL